jgi:hypothetical protein
MTTVGELESLQPINASGMDFMQRNLEFIHTTVLHNTAVDEFVQAEQRVESKFHRAKGVWWREVKPFFYYPAVPGMAIVPGEFFPKPWRALGGYYHRVPKDAAANGQIVVNQVPDLQQFRLDRLKKKVRYDIRHGLSTFELRRITLSEDSLEQAFYIYSAWEKRIGDVRVRRSNPAVFRAWATRVLQHPFNLVIGAYQGQRLAAYIITSAVEGCADVSKSFTALEFYPESPTSCLYYAYVSICAHSTGIQSACNGLRSMNVTLQQYKEKLGYSPVCYPAFICLRPVIKPLVRHFLPRQYRRLMGEYPEQAVSPEAA